MPTPFPGMDPYLEGYLWPDVHSALAHKIRQQLAPQLQPKYVARIEISVVEDSQPGAEIGIMYPDVEVIELSSVPTFSRDIVGNTGNVMKSVVAPFTIPLPQIRLASVAIRDVAHNVLISSIAILSPVNKREPNLTQYRQKRERLREAQVHLLEIDLLRRGTRAWTHPRIPASSYLVLLNRAQAHSVEAWPISLSAPLPLLPVPLRVPDPDVVVDLAAALTAIYEEAFYHLSIDYSQDPPPPALSSEEKAWLQSCLQGRA